MLRIIRVSELIFKDFHKFGPHQTPKLYRFRCSKVDDTKTCERQSQSIEFFDGKLKHSSKVPQSPFIESENLPKARRDIIDKETLLLLERLSLVNVEDK